jgi:hypothetical protein
LLIARFLSCVAVSNTELTLLITVLPISLLTVRHAVLWWMSKGRESSLRDAMVGYLWVMTLTAGTTNCIKVMLLDVEPSSC